jgi:hypothetical protein
VELLVWCSRSLEISHAPFDLSSYEYYSQDLNLVRYVRLLSYTWCVLARCENAVVVSRLLSEPRDVACVCILSGTMVGNNVDVLQ